MITSKDIADKLFPYRWSLKFNQIELVGEEKTFGHILVDNKVKLPVFINNAEQIMDAIEDFMLNTESEIEEAIQRKLETSL